jgi:hypothetical protein
LLNKSISKKNEEINNFWNEILKLFFGFQNRINKERMRIIERVLNGGTVLFNSNRVRLAVNVAKARFALCHTYSFLPFRSEAKTCQEQVSPRLSKMNFCPSAPC